MTRDRSIHGLLSAGAVGLLTACASSAGTTKASGGSAGAGGAPAGAAGFTAGSAGVAASGAGGGGTSIDPGALSVERVATWKHDADAAYSMIHDDMCDWTTTGLDAHADAELSARSLVAGFGAIVDTCVQRNEWTTLSTLAAHGDEIINHSWDHHLLTTDRNYAVEVDQAATTLEDHGLSVSFFIFPEDTWDDQALQYIKDAGYVGARAGVRGVNTANFPDRFGVAFDVYGPYSTNPQDQITIYPTDTLRAHVDAAVASGGWAVREFHGIEDSSWNSIPLADYQAHLDYLKGLVDVGTLWVATPSDVVRYRFARENCGVPAVTGASIEFSAQSADCARFATALSVIVRTEIDVPALQVSQNGAIAVALKLGPSEFALDMDPIAGSATVTGIATP